MVEMMKVTEIKTLAERNEEWLDILNIDAVSLRNCTLVPEGQPETTKIYKVVTDKGKDVGTYYADTKHLVLDLRCFNEY